MSFSFINMYHFVTAVEVSDSHTEAFLTYYDIFVR